MFFIFFFQAEDGIRDYKVTGVQTCALPISSSRSTGPSGSMDTSASGPSSSTATRSRISCVSRVRSAPTKRAPRSEERRVGKEWRAGVAPDEGTKKEDDRG